LRAVRPVGTDALAFSALIGFNSRLRSGLKVIPYCELVSGDRFFRLLTLLDTKYPRELALASKLLFRVLES